MYLYLRALKVIGDNFSEDLNFLRNGFDVEIELTNLRVETILKQDRHLEALEEVLVGCFLKKIQDYL